MVMVFKATFKNISVLLVEETGVSEKTNDLSQVPCKRCQQYFSYIMATSFSCGGSQSTRTTTDHREATGKLSLGYMG